MRRKHGDTEFTESTREQEKNIGASFRERKQEQREQPAMFLIIG